MVIKSNENLEVIIQALRTYKNHPQICLHLTYAIMKNALTFMENEQSSKALFNILFDILTGSKLDVDLLNNLLSILSQCKYII